MCERQVRQLLQRHWDDERCDRLVTRLEDFWSALFTCLDYPGIPPDNNRAEQVLRKLVIQRKISGGNRSAHHATYHAKLMSVIETLRLQGGQLLPTVQTLLKNSITAQLSHQ